MKRRLLSASALALAALATGCGTSGHDDAYAQDPGFTAPADVQRVGIDTGGTVSADAGDGAGLFVEYSTGGEYHVFTTCDTNISKQYCEWRIVASIDPAQSLDFTDDGNFEADDSITRIDDGAVRLVFVSDVDFDGAVLKVPPGEPLRLNWLLDGFARTDMLSWVSGGTVQTGAPSDPVDLEPTTP
jgi:hypothetical protein